MSEYTCPECGSTEVTLTHEQSFMANSGEHYCHSVKIQDSDSQARCIDCGWTGIHEQLVGYKK
jgi:transcription elongation factor Elf1